jgi:PTH1 family peptidyl-tRNA hydrolase
MIDFFRRITSVREPNYLTIVVGLGNPGVKYKNTRHNVGFWCLDQIVDTHSIIINKKKRYFEFGQGDIGNKKIVLARSRTFMNESGRAIQSLMTKYKVLPANFLVLYDDMDLPAGSIRLRARGSSGGHNGMKSIVDSIGTTEFPRLRIGIGRPEFSEQNISHVLSEASLDERKRINEALCRATQAVEMFLVDGIDASMDRFNK